MKNKTQNIISFLVLILLLASCMVGPNFQSPEISSPAKFTNDSILEDSVINLEWWEIFQDEKLNALIKTSLTENLDVKIAAKRIEESAYIVGYNKADLLPSFGYDGGVMRGNIGANGAPTGSVGTLYSGVGNVYWELDFWGKYRRSTEAAKAELLASEYGQRIVQIAIISNVATLYFQLADYRSRLTISEETLESRKESLRIIQERFNKGIIPEIDLNQAIIQEAIAASNVPYYERLVASVEHALSVLLGHYPGEIESTDLVDLKFAGDIPVGIPSLLLERRPDILQSEQYYKAQNSRIGIAQAMRFPSINLTGVLGAASSDLSSLASADALVWSASAGITGPLFNFGKNKRKVDIERSRAEQARLSHEKTVLGAFAEVEDALISINTVSRELSALERQLGAAEQAAKLSRARYDGGVTSYLEVLETERSLFESELLTANAFQRLLNSYVFLYKSLGGGWISEGEKNAAQEANKETIQE